MPNPLQRLFQPKPKHPYHLFQIEPSLECSLDCVMCPWKEMRPGAGSMSAATFKNIATNLYLTEEVDFTGGGEPLKNPNLVEMVRVAKQAGCITGFSTNAVRLTPEISAQLIESGLDWISFSIDAATPALYEKIRQGARFGDVIGNIAALRDLKIRLHRFNPKMMAVFVMMRENSAELPGFVDLCRQLGIESLIAKNLDVILKDGDDARRVFSHDTSGNLTEIEKIRAEAQARARQQGIDLRTYALRPQEVPVCDPDPTRNLFFNWEGNVSPCITLYYAESRIFNGRRVDAPCLRFGNIDTESLDTIWNKPAYRKFRQVYEQRRQVQQTALIDALLNASSDLAQPPTAPEVCQSCYYLYGI